MFKRYFVALPFTMKCAWHFVVFFLAQAPESSIDQRLCLRSLEAFGWHQGRSPTWERRPGPQAQSKAVAAPSEGDLLLHWQRRWRWWESGWTACWMRAWLTSGRSSVWKMTVFFGFRLDLTENSKQIKQLFWLGPEWLSSVRTPLDSSRLMTQDHSFNSFQDMPQKPDLGSD